MGLARPVKGAKLPPTHSFPQLSPGILPDPPSQIPSQCSLLSADTENSSAAACHHLVDPHRYATPNQLFLLLLI
ncbi:hypothetical protein JTE90_009883 [Oedothorax gibbosus]|uniref:Uncharacterized protein n=1 Tax=Oedothorax gibbosus TaxID=931172 RepID=A0AAV6UX09_9ARAC|nr:hypothetical protein JTE90_009883 [Oedothorax gibbosus]